MSAVPDELFDMVDARDRVITQAPRAEVHRRGQRHRAVHVLLANAAGKLFLQKRSASKDQYPGCWDSSASGHLDAGETYEAAARRELYEEIGLRTDGPLEAFARLPAEPAEGNEFTLAYRLRAEGPFRCDAGEIAEARWWDRGELAAALEATPDKFSPRLRRLFSLYTVTTP